MQVLLIIALKTWMGQRSMARWLPSADSSSIRDDDATGQQWVKQYAHKLIPGAKLSALLKNLRQFYTLTMAQVTITEE